MKMFHTFFLIALAALTASCNEKISPELNDSGVFSPTPSGTSANTSYSFKLVNTSADILNYKLHQAGSGNSSLACEVESVGTPLSHDLFGTSTNDITCYLEAEELSLYAEGFSFQIESSANTCDFVTYQPFSYYNRRPGDSSGTYTQISCVNDETTTAHVAAMIPGSLYDSDGDGVLETQATCDDWLSESSLLSANRNKFTPVDDEELCRFNYSDGDEEKCDIGTITVNDYQVTYDSSVPTTTVKVVSRIVKCGGKAANCVAGPIKFHELLKGTRGSLITTMEADKASVISHEYPSLINKANGTYRYANFRRNLANSSIAYTQTADPYVSPATYADFFLDEKTFDPTVLEKYVHNRRDDGVLAISPADLDTYSTESRIYSAKPLAAEPYLGLGNAYYTHPFYTFECLDTAREPKARIRLMVRDWDRIFPTGTGASDIELISDIYKVDPTNLARQDISATEATGGYGDWDNFNDFWDWDDFIAMERDPGLPLIFRPVPDYFDTSLFPGDVKDDD